MQKLNNNFLTFYYETFSFLLPRSFAANKQMVSYKFKNWVILDSFKQASQLRNILKVLCELNKKNKAENMKFLFIIDEKFYFFFNKIFLNNDCFFTSSVKEALFFLDSAYAKNVSSVIYVGFLDNLPENLTSSWKCPSFFFTPKIIYKNTYVNYNSLSFQSSVLLLKSFFEEILAVK